MMRTEAQVVKHREQNRAYRARNRDAIRASDRARHAADPSKKHRLSARYYRKNREKIIAKSSAYSKKIETVCRIRGVDPVSVPPKPVVCDATGRGGTICLDHDHRTGKFRGWLERRCNVILGLAEDDPALLRALADYLDRHK
jgi:hypothetical protein